MENNINYTINNIKKGETIRKYINKIKDQLKGNIVSNITLKPIGINIGLIDELKNQGYEINGKIDDVTYLKYKMEYTKNNFIKAIREQKEFIEYTVDSQRNIGKTKLLIDLSNKYKIPILTSNPAHSRYLKTLSCRVKIINNIDEVKSLDIVLIDEGISYEDFNYLRRIVTTIGFYNL